MRSVVSNHPKATLIIAAVVIVVVAFVLYWFEPQALLIDKRVNEGLPAISAGASDGSPSRDAEGSDDQTKGGDQQDSEVAAKVLGRGELRGINHSATGNALLVRLADGSHILRFEDLMAENGPDLRVYLSAASATSDGPTFNDDYVELGELKGNIGDQNYVIPGDVDLSRYGTPVIWCKRFEVGFAVADIR